MATTRWIHGAGGDFNTASNWTDGIPGSGDTALITASGTYTVTDSQDNTVGVLEMAKDASLALTSHVVFHVTSGTGAGALAGTIALEPGSDSALIFGTDGASTKFDDTGAIDVSQGVLEISGEVTLAGNGQINLSEGFILSDGKTATLTNGNTISGYGAIGYVAEFSIDDLSFDNESTGVVDANVTDESIAIDAEKVSNAGVLEATGSGILDIFSNITQTSTGKIEAAGPLASVEFEGITITGGAVSTVAGGALFAAAGDNTIDTTSAVVNAGEIQTDGGNLTITHALNNTDGLLYADTGNITVSGSVNGGSADIYQGSLTLGGPSSTNVSFLPDATGIFYLADATQFTGTVAGMQSDPSAAIDLENMPLVGSVISFNDTTDVLTVTDPGTHVTDNIKIAGSFSGLIIGTPGIDGSALVSLVSIGSKSATSGVANLGLLGNYIASTFAVAEGQVDTMAVAQTTQSETVLAHPHAG
jgi:hypothetical protein